MEELQPFQEPNLSGLEVGSACLAKHSDGIWYTAKITGEVPASALRRGAGRGWRLVLSVKLWVHDRET